MQNQRSGLDSFSETFDLNQGSFCNNISMDRSASWDNRLSPVESRLSSHMPAPCDGNINCVSDAEIRAQINRGWDLGESSSSGTNIQEQVHDGDIDTRLAWYSSSGACSGSDLRSEDWSAEPSTIRSSSYVGNQVTDRSLNMQSCGSTHASLNLSSNHGHLRENNHHKSGHFVTEQIRSLYASCSNIGTSSGSSTPSSENNDAAGPSFRTWGSSCKRKGIEGTSQHFYPAPGGSSNSDQPMENIMQHPVSGFSGATGNLSISSGSLSSVSSTNQLESRSGVGTRRLRSGHFPSSSVERTAESPTGNLALRSNPGNHESTLFHTSRGISVRRSSVYAAQPQLQTTSNSNTLELISPMTVPRNSNNTLNQALVHVNEARGTDSNPWNRSSSSRRGSSSSSFSFSGERGSRMHEEVNIRSSVRNNPDYPVLVPAPETRNIPEDQIDWSFTPGTSVSSRNYSSGLRIGPNSGGRSPRNSLPPIESDPGTERSPFALSPLASSSSFETATTSRARHQLDRRRSAALLMGMPGDDTNGWNVLAAVEGRHRLIHQILNAVRRGVQLQAEELMLIDPFVNGFAELHDRHRDMRLDVDNMSYEELLALEERIGNVSTGLSEEQIKRSMKQRKYEVAKASPNMEPCCICQEDYVAGGDIGILDCGHEFHSSCIKQWLLLKNICPICKMTALET